MKKAFLLFSLLFSFLAQSQVLYIPPTGKSDSVKVLVNINGVARNVFVADLLKDVKSSITNTTVFDPATKQDVLQSGITLKTVGGVSLLGSGDVPAGSSTADGIRVLSSPPVSGNVYLNSTNNQLGVKNGSTWYYFTSSSSVATQNLILQSQNFNSAPWTPLGNGTVAANTMVAPDGTTTADTYTSSNSAYSILRQTKTYTAGIYHVIVHAKKTNWNYIGLRAISNPPSFPAQIWGNNTPFVDLSTGTALVNNAPATSITATSEGNGWYMIDMVVNNPEIQSDFFDIVFTDSNGDASFAPNGTQTVGLWGAQLTSGSGNKAYGETTTSIIP